MRRSCGGTGCVHDFYANVDQLAVLRKKDSMPRVRGRTGIALWGYPDGWRRPATARMTASRSHFGEELFGRQRDWGVLTLFLFGLCRESGLLRASLF